MPGDGLRVLLGAIILLLLALHVFRRRLGVDGMLDHWWVVAVTGVLAGFGTTVGNAAGPVMSIYLVSKRLDKHEFLGTSAWFFFIVNVSKIPGFIVLGMITPATLAFDAVILPLVVAGALLGAAVLRRIPQWLFASLVLILAGVAALRLILY
jgi:uncharacterized membrane protein YfcA